MSFNKKNTIQYMINSFSSLFTSCIAVIFLHFFPLTAHSQNTIPKKVLFIGNSYTYVNNLPQLISDLASATNDSVWHDSSTPGGSTFQMHTQNATTLQKITSQNWDYVVLQAQSQEPALAPTNVQTNTYPFAKILNDSIKSNNICSETIFYMTWGRKNGDATFCPTYTPVCTYDGMQSRLRTSYLEMADSNNATISPVGMAFKYCRQQFPAINLYQADESHPSLEGSYLAACVFYSIIFQKSPIGNTFISTLNSTDANSLQFIANQTVFDSLSLWRINANHSDPSFSFSQVGSNFQFTSNLNNNSNWLWDFGDGNFSSLQNPNHNYAVAGNYYVTLKTNNSCFTDSSAQFVNTMTSINDQANIESSNAFIYPNPSSGKIHVKVANNDVTIEIYNSLGECVLQEKNNGNSIDLSKFENGMYSVRMIESFQNKRTNLILHK